MPPSPHAASRSRVQVDAQRIRRSRGQCGQLRQRLGRLRWGVQVGTTDARKRRRFGITAARNSASRSSKAAAASASSRSAYIASRLARKLSVSSTRCNGQPRFLTARLPGLIPSGVLIAARRCCSWPMAAPASTVRPAAMSAKPRFASSSNSRWIRSRSSR